MNTDGPSVVPTHPNTVELERLLDLIREFDALGGWGNGFRSGAHWLSWRIGLESGAACEHARVARALGTLPRLRQALASGELSYSKVRALNRALHVYPDGDGMVVIRGRLEPEVGAVLVHALAAAREALYRRRETKDVPAGTSVVDAEVLADANAPGQSVLEGGARVPAETSQRLACDASRMVMRHDPDGRITEVGARTRTIPPALRRALQHRDKGGRFPGCGLPFGQGHHIRHWHHRAVHEDGYHVERQVDGELCFRRPDGQLLSESPAVPPVSVDPVGTLRDRLDADGLRIGARTAMPGWLGERLDVGYAGSVLHPLADPAICTGR